jgi:YHS domain-containing protein
MTSARRRQILAMLAALPMLPAGSAVAAVTERVVTDFHTGLALNGFDPVAYFTDAAPIPGRAELEYRFKGVIWRFANEGNLAAFARNADQYVPRFGGYDPIAIAHGIALAGNPAFWLIAHDRLYLFYSSEALTRFKADADRAIAAAEAKWPTVEDGLIP